MQDNKKIPLCWLCALAFFAGLFGFLGAALVAGYIFLSDKRQEAKKSATAALAVLIGFAVVEIFFRLIGLFVTYGGFPIYEALIVIRGVVLIVLACVKLFSGKADAAAVPVKDPDPIPPMPSKSASEQDEGDR